MLPRDNTGRLSLKRNGLERRLVSARLSAEPGKSGSARVCCHVATTRSVADSAQIGAANG